MLGEREWGWTDEQRELPQKEGLLSDYTDTRAITLQHDFSHTILITASSRSNSFHQEWLHSFIVYTLQSVLREKKKKKRLGGQSSAQMKRVTGVQDALIHETIKRLVLLF